jgi:ribosomal protein S18 acetylase RimI-like enzyme
MIRDAEEADLVTMAEATVRIQEDYVRQFPDVYRHFSIDDARSYLSTLVDRPEAYLRVLEDAGQIVAHAITQIEARQETLFENARKVAYLAQIEVEPDSRRKGYGRLLLDDCRRIGTAEGVDRLVLDVWAFNGPAQDFFRTAGWQDFGSKLTIVVDGKPDAV